MKLANMIPLGKETIPIHVIVLSRPMTVHKCTTYIYAACWASPWREKVILFAPVVLLVRASTFILESLMCAILLQYFYLPSAAEI